MPRGGRKVSPYLVIFLVGMIACTGFLLWQGGFFSAFGIGPATDDTTDGSKVAKTITVTGVFVQPSGAQITAAGGTNVFGAATFFDSAGQIVSSGAIVAATGAFSVSIPSGESYQLYFQPLLGNGVNFPPKVFQCEVPFYSSDSEVTTYNFASAFVVYARSAQLSITTVFGGNAMTRYLGGAYTGATGGTNNPAQGSGDGTYAGTIDWFYHLGGGITNNVPAVMMVSMTNMDDWSTFGYELSIPNYASYTVKPWVVVSFGANASAWLQSCGSYYKPFMINSTVKAWAFEFPVVEADAAGATGAISMTWMFPAAVAHTYFNVWVGFNSTVDYLAGAGGFTAPIGYGSAWWIHVIGGAPTGVDGSALNVL